MRFLGQELFDALCEGNVAFIKDGISDLSQDQQDDWMKDAMLRAAYEGKEQGVKTLLELGTPSSVVDGLGQTPLHWAARQGHNVVAKVLVKAKANIEARNQDQITPLHLASQFNTGSIVTLLLSNKADPTSKTVDHSTPLHLAAEYGSAVAVAVLLESQKKPDESGDDVKDTMHILLEHQNERGETPLDRAAKKGHGAVVQLLLQAGANSNHRNCFGQTALHLACFMGHAGAASVLLDAGANANATSQDGSTPLHAAVERGHSQVVELLISHGADLRFVAAGARTPLHVASEKGHAECVEAVLAAGADSEVKTEDLRTALSLASTRGHVAVVAKLLAYAADPHALDNVSQTPIHSAAYAGRGEVCQLLFQKRARLEQPDGSGRTPIQLALAARQDSAVRALLKLGAILPEADAKDPKLQPMIHQVEHEVLQEQLKQAEQGASKQEVRAAEQQFEEGRSNLVKFTILNATSGVTGVIAGAEIRLVEAKDLARTSVQAESEMKAELVEVDKELQRLVSETKEKNKDIDLTRRELGMIRDAKLKKIEELTGLKKAIEAVIQQVKTAQSKESGASTETQQALRKIETLKKTLADLIATGDNIDSQLVEVRGEVDKWVMAKDEVAALHAEAHKLLNKPGKLYGYCSPNAPASPSGKEAEEADPPAEEPSDAPETSA